MGISTRTVDRLTATGELQSYKIGTRVLIDEKDLGRFLKAHKKPHPLMTLLETGPVHFTPQPPCPPRLTIYGTGLASFNKKGPGDDATNKTSADEKARLRGLAII